MATQYEETLKAAYAHGANTALTEAGIASDVAEGIAVKLAEEATGVSEVDNAIKLAYIHGVSAAIQEQGFDKQASDAEATKWVNR